MAHDVHGKRPPRPAEDAQNRAPGRRLGDRARSRERVHVRCLMARRCGWVGRRVEALDADAPFGTCPRCGAPVVARRGGGRWRATDLSRREELYLSRRLQESLQAWDELAPDDRPARHQAVACDVVEDALEVARYLQAWLERQEDR